MFPVEITEMIQISAYQIHEILEPRGNRLGICLPFPFETI